MSSNANMRSSLRRVDFTTTICVARKGKLCRCSTCTSSFAPTATTVSDVSTTCPPSEIDDREISEGLEIPSLARCQPLQAFPTATTIIESVYDYQDNEPSAGEFVGPNGGYRPPSQNSLNSSFSRVQSFPHTDSLSSVASGRAVRTPKVNAPQRNEGIVWIANVNNYEYEEPATLLPPLQAPIRSIRAQRLGTTRSDYNLTPTPAIPLGRPKERRRFLERSTHRLISNGASVIQPRDALNRMKEVPTLVPKKTGF
ncbi:hypothetical protein RSAG8_03715, partial [Rhizoctonia solani AG-8 WAC10335]